MEPLPIPKTFTVYQLVKMTGMYISLTGVAPSSNSLGTGFYSTRLEAEHNRTLELLKDVPSTGAKPTFHIFELEFPNPVYKE